MNTYDGSEIGIFERIPVGRIRHSRRMVRAPSGDIDDLVASIRDNGLLEPIVVRPEEDSYEVVAGNRRLEACRRLHKRSVACHVVTMDDVSSYEMSLIENVQRRNMNPIEEGIAFRRYVDDYGFGGISQLARNIGKSESYVSRRVALLDLPDSIAEAVLNGKISSVIAQELIPLPKSEAVALGRLALGAKLSREDVRAVVRATRDAADIVPAVQSGEAGGSERTRAERTLAKAITAMRVCLMRLDSTVDSLEDEDWIFKEALIESRRGVHQMIDRLIKLKVRRERMGSAPQIRTLSSHEIAGTPRRKRDHKARDQRAASRLLVG